MGIPEWMLTVDSRQTKILHNNACIQILLHFKGAIANQLEQDFSKLISIGRLDAPTLYIPGYIDTKRKAKLSYKQCGMRDPNERSNQILYKYNISLFIKYFYFLGPRKSWFGTGSCGKIYPTEFSIVLTILMTIFYF